jgi:hypothetical protein
LAAAYFLGGRVLITSAVNSTLTMEAVMMEYCSMWNTPRDQFIAEMRAIGKTVIVPMFT